MWPSHETSLSVALFVVVVLVLGSLGAAGLAPSAQDGTAAAQPRAPGDLALPERVVLTDAEASGSTVVGTDAAAAVESSASELEGAYERYLLEERIDAANTDAERRAAINRSVDDIERRVENLREREDSARRAYLAGNIDEAAYLAALRYVDDRAGQLQQRARLISPPARERTSGFAERYGASRAGSRIDSLRADIIALEGPVRDALGDRMRNDVAPTRFHVSAAPDATVLSYIDDGTYYREAIRPSVVARDDSNGLSLDETIDLTNDELYPRFASQYGFSVFSTISSNRIHNVFGERQYQYGSIESYIDAVSQNVFWESQRMTLTGDLPREPPITDASGGLEVSVRPTYETGPASVRVTEDGTAAANVSVSVDGEIVAETDDEGVAWIVVPNGGATVSVTTGGETVRVPID